MDYFMLAARILRKSVISFAGLNAMSLHTKALLDHGRDLERIISHRLWFYHTVMP